MNRRNHRTLAGLALAALLAAIAVLAGCGSALSTATSAASAGANAAAEANPNLDLGTSLDNAPAPDFTLTNQFGQPKAQLAGLNAYVKAAAKDHLPALVAVDETVTEPSAQVVGAYLGGLTKPDYPVGLDQTGRVADGYGVQDQPWLVLVSAAGKVVWSHAGWLPLPELEKAAAAHA